MSRIQSLAHKLGTSFIREPKSVSDGDLLARFLEFHDETAFEELITRHLPAVRAVCRSLLRDPNDAEDATQATFLVFVRRARVVRNRQALGAWLCRVAWRTATRLRVANERRSEKFVPGLEPDSIPDRFRLTDSNDVNDAVQEEIRHLPEKYRLAVLVCYAAGVSTAEAANHLGWTKGTLLTRLAWARKRLSSRLMKRGVTLSGSIATVLMGRSSHAVDAILVSRISAAGSATVLGDAIASIKSTVRNAVVLRTSSRSVAVAPTVADLTQGVLRMFWLRKLASIGVTLVTIGLIGTGIWFGSDEGPRANGQPPSPSSALPPDKLAQEIERLKSCVRELELQQELAKQVGGTLELQVGSGERPLEIKERDWRGAVLLRIWPTDIAALERFLIRSHGDKNGPRRLLVNFEPTHPADKVKQILAACRIGGYDPETTWKGAPTPGSSYVIECPDVLRIEANILVCGVALPLPQEAIAGSFIVRPDGTVGLGTHGSVSVTGLTTTAAANAIRTHLLEKKELKDRGTNAESLIVSVLVESSNSKAIYVIVSGRDGTNGEFVIKMPWTEGLALVDVLRDLGVAQPIVDAKEIHIARRSAKVGGGDPWQNLPVNWKGIMNGVTTTNYVVMPGDRISVNFKK